jgi:hypothetical protein
LQIQTVTFSESKAGNAPAECQDGACGGVVGPTGMARFIVSDGASTAYDSARWVDQLVTSFMSPGGGPALEPAAMRAWFAQMQDQWAADVPPFGSLIEERKFHEVGSFATVLGFEICGLDGPEPSWRAVALGDTVLFHVRASRLVAVFPQLGPENFGPTPDGVHTLQPSLDWMTERLLFGEGVLSANDFLFAATDAMAQWILRALGWEQEKKVWDVLGGLAHPAIFSRFVDDQRREIDSAKRMKNDDITLMRLRVLADPPWQAQHNV